MVVQTRVFVESHGMPFPCSAMVVPSCCFIHRFSSLQPSCRIFSAVGSLCALNHAGPSHLFRLARLPSHKYKHPLILPFSSFPFLSFYFPSLVYFVRFSDIGV